MRPFFTSVLRSLIVADEGRDSIAEAFDWAVIRLIALARPALAIGAEAVAAAARPALTFTALFAGGQFCLLLFTFARWLLLTLLLFGALLLITRIISALFAPLLATLLIALFTGLVLAPVTLLIIAALLIALVALLIIAPVTLLIFAARAPFALALLALLLRTIFPFTALQRLRVFGALAVEVEIGSKTIIELRRRRHRLHRAHHAIIMLGVLQVVFGLDPVPGRTRIARQLHILFVDMRRWPANLHVRSVALERAVRLIPAATAAARLTLAATASLTLHIVVQFKSRMHIRALSRAKGLGWHLLSYEAASRDDHTCQFNSAVSLAAPPTELREAS